MSILEHRQKRLRKELDSFNHEPPDGITAGPDDKELTIWSASIAGPDGSPYAGGTFFLEISYPWNYPTRPPKVKFKTKIYHPNISSDDGTVFVDILYGQWCPALTARPILVSIQSLLTDPNPEDSAEPEISHEYVHDRKKFDETAWEWTVKYAMD